MDTETWITTSEAAALIGVPELEVIDWADYGFISAARLAYGGWLIDPVEVRDFANAHQRYRERKKARTKRKDRGPWQPEPWRQNVYWMMSELSMHSYREALKLLREHGSKAFNARKCTSDGRWYVDADWVREVAKAHKGYTGKRTAKRVWEWIKEYDHG
jgi:hypothetical protein